MCICILLKLDMGRTSAQHFTVKTNSRPSFLIHTRKRGVGFQSNGFYSATLHALAPLPLQRVANRTHPGVPSAQLWGVLLNISIARSGLPLSLELLHPPSSLSALLLWASSSLLGDCVSHDDSV